MYRTAPSYPLVSVVHRAWPATVYRLHTDGIRQESPRSIPGRPDEAADVNGDRFEQDLLRDVMSQVESHYRVERRPQYRAIAGMSMGEFQALAYGLRHSDRLYFQRRSTWTRRRQASSECSYWKELEASPDILDRCRRQRSATERCAVAPRDSVRPQCGASVRRHTERGPYMGILAAMPDGLSSPTVQIDSAPTPARMRCSCHRCASICRHRPRSRHTAFR
jgi:Putative esterase